MKKRVLSFVLTANLLFLFLFGRLFTITVVPKTVSTDSSIRVKDVATTRGNIYDTNLKPLVNNKKTYVTCVKPTSAAMSILKDKGASLENLKKLSMGYFLLLPTESQHYFNQTEDIKTLTTFCRYNDSTALHIIGYTDSSGNGICGIEKYYNDELTEYGGSLSVAYSADANGRMLTGEDVEIRENGYYNKDGIVLTIDRDIQKIAENALIKGGIEKGTAIVLDVNTSAIIACCSTPTYDRNNLEKYINDENSPFLNRAFSAYPVGSVFKVITAAAAIENDIKPLPFNCTGSIEKSGNIFNCNKLEGHGNIDLNAAISHSCNPYFIELGTKVGAKKLLHTAENVGFGKSIDLGKGYFTDEGILPDHNELNSDAAVGNFAFGQGRFTATPLQIAALFATIANNGTYNEPYLIKGTTDKEGAFSPEISKGGIKVFKDNTCHIIKRALLKTTIDGTGAIAFSSLFNSCAKTATAQSGQYDKNGNEIKYCWFAGFFPYNDPKYVVCILKENGISGGSDGGPVFKEICENIYINDKFEF